MIYVKGLTTYNILWGTFVAELLLVEFAMNSSRCELDVSMVATSCIVPPLVFNPVPGCKTAIWCVLDRLQVVGIPVFEYAEQLVEAATPMLEEGEDAEFWSTLLLPLTLNPTLPHVEATDGGEQVLVSITQLAYLLVGLLLRFAKFARSFERRYCNCSSWLWPFTCFRKELGSVYRFVHPTTSHLYGF